MKFDFIRNDPMINNKNNKNNNKPNLPLISFDIMLSKTRFERIATLRCIELFQDGNQSCKVAGGGNRNARTRLLTCTISRNKWHLRRPRYSKRKGSRCSGHERTGRARAIFARCKWVRSRGAPMQTQPRRWKGRDGLGKTNIDDSGTSMRDTDLPGAVWPDIDKQGHNEHNIGRFGHRGAHIEERGLAKPGDCNRARPVRPNTDAVRFAGLGASMISMHSMHERHRLARPRCCLDSNGYPFSTISNAHVGINVRTLDISRFNYTWRFMTGLIVGEYSFCR